MNRAAVALHVLVRAAQAFAGAGGAIRPAVLARELRVDGGELADIIATLVRSGWLAPVAGDPPRYVLASDPAGIGLAPLQDLSTAGVVPHACDPRVTPLLHAVSGAGRRVWSDWTLADVLAGRRSSAEAPDPYIVERTMTRSGHRRAAIFSLYGDRCCDKSRIPRRSGAESDSARS
ncbi:MAG TPA: hypothetical protein VN812_18065 [Candidatus Acidoferrales bacterium]|nr:hypothetical protein [Candidatus Acidoferrales bacterium]